MSDATSESELPEGYTDRINHPSPSMVADLNRRFRDRLRRLVRREMGFRFRRREDSEDVVQEALFSFYQALAGKTVQLDHSGGLWPLLKQFTHYKILQHVEYHLRPPRNIGQEKYVDVEDLPLAGPTETDAVEVVDNIEAAVARLLRMLCEVGLKTSSVALVRDKLRGISSSEVAERNDCSMAKVNRTMAWVRGRFEELLEDQASQGRESPCPSGG